MKKLLTHFIAILLFVPALAQINKDELALKIASADDANTQKLKDYIWKRKSDVFLDGQLKMTTITEFSFDEKGELTARLVDAESTVKQKPGLRGRAQANAAEGKMEYIEKALQLSLAYSFMTKGQLLDFFGKATVTEKDGSIEAVGENIYVKGDKLLVRIDPKTNLYTFKEFSSLIGKDPVDGKMTFEKFSTGVNHGAGTTLNMPAQKMKIEAVNQDYSTRIK